MRLVAKSETKRSNPEGRTVTGIPKGFHEIQASVYLNAETGEVVITGYPVDGDDAEDSAHNCDVMGCWWEHIIVRARASTTHDRENLKAFVRSNEATE
jgi:hypothetical protein